MSSSFSIYDLDEDIRKLLNLDNFLNGMSVTSFIEELSKDHFNKGQEVNKLEYLDPKPYIRTFESTLRELKQLEGRAEKQRSHSERDTEQFELKHSENVVRLSNKIDAANADFDAVDAEISQVVERLNPLGSKLTKISASRDRSQETIFLIRAFHGFYTKGGYEPLDSLRSSKRREDQIKCARTLRQLRSLGQKLGGEDATKHTKTCVERIEEFCESSEQRWLQHFQTAWEYDDLPKMKETADVLTDFNGGGSVVQRFIENTNSSLLSPPEDPEPSLLDAEDVWVKLQDPNFVDKIEDPGTKQVLDRLKFAIKGQSRIILQVFKEPTQVLRTFLQRVYLQIIYERVSEILSFSLTVGMLAHVRILHTLYLLVQEFTSDIKDFLVSNEFDRDNEVVGVVNSGFYEIFSEFLGDQYWTREKRSLVEIIYSNIHQFTTANEDALKSRQLHDKIRERIEPFKQQDQIQTENRRLQQFKIYAKKQASKVTAAMGSSSDQPHLEPKPNFDSQLEISTVETVLKSSIESIARMMELAPTKSSEYAMELLEIVIFDFSTLYIFGGLEVSYDRLLDNPQSWAWMPLFGHVTSMLYLVTAVIKQIFIPCALNTPALKQRMSSLSNNFISQCEIGLNVILNDTIEIIANKVTTLLAKQKKKDFLTDAIDGEEDTEACEALSEYLQEVYYYVQKSLNGANLKNALIRIGMNVLNQLLEHYKKFTVDYTGGIVLTKDVLHYQMVIDEWGIEELSDQFQLLKEIGNLFTVSYGLIDSLVTEGKLATLKAYTIRQYVQKRADFHQKRTMGEMMESLLLN
ncbi:hypothetical protein DIURU_004185 [Diutina rugosa]|uniref:Uncharacterized protein n=1 Tax=Diutina rugosa TaxID=5481 RepID=A0A642UIN7_DIURU|nr:uncharacterized protein DIURU_004185 [Diutina rugosa]KAA8899702.1 hypothetical protein DIURU_004185 [Diutina rugosa]